MVAAGSGDAVVMVRPAVTVSEKVPEVLPPALSVTETGKLKEPVAVGLPESKPAALMVNPAGAWDADQVYDGTPGFAENCCE